MHGYDYRIYHQGGQSLIDHSFWAKSLSNCWPAAPWVSLISKRHKACTQFKYEFTSPQELQIIALHIINIQFRIALKAIYYPCDIILINIYVYASMGLRKFTCLRI